MTIDRMKAAFNGAARRADPRRSFRGLSEYTVAEQRGRVIDCSPVDTSRGLPPLTNVKVRPSLLGGRSTLAPGTSIAIGFLDESPAKPYVAFADPANDPIDVELRAGDMVGGEHAISAEAVCVLIFNTFSQLCIANPGILIGTPLQVFILPAIIAALARQGIPAPPSVLAQAAAATAEAAASVAGTPISSSLPFQASLAIVATKTPNVSGLFPSVGCPAIKVG